MKKVLFLITKAQWGGAQRYVYDLATHLPRGQFRPLSAYGEPGRLSSMLADAGVETIPLQNLGRDVSILEDLTSFFAIRRCIRSVRPDIVHLNSSKAAALGALAAFITRVPRIVFTVHGWPFKEDRNIIARILIYLISWFTALLSDTVIVVSHEDEVLGRGMWFVADKVHYVPLGIDIPPFLSRDDAKKFLRGKTSSDDIPEHSIVIGTIAELTRNKGVHFALEALAILRREATENYVYVVIGEGEERKTLEAIARSLGVEDKVFFLGFVPDAARYLRAFDIFLLPSVKEGMPYVLLEAGEAGIPIIASAVANPDIALMYGHLRYIQAGNPLAIAETVRNTNITHPANEKHVPRYPLSRMVAETTSLYLSVQQP